MTSFLPITDQQRNALLKSGGTPVYAFDDVEGERYVLMRAADYDSFITTLIEAGHDLAHLFRTPGHISPPSTTGGDRP